MVVQAKSSRAHLSQTTQPKKGYLRQAFMQSLTIHNLNLDNIPDSHLGPILYLALVSFSCSVIFMANIVKSMNNPVSIAAELAILTIIQSVVYSCMCIVISYLSALLSGHEYTSKHFGLIASSFTYIPIAQFLLLLVPSGISFIFQFGSLLLMNYYIQSTYSEYFPPSAQRTQVIHGIYTFMAYFVIQFVCGTTPAIVHDWELMKQVIV